MPSLKFLPLNTEVECKENEKILKVALKGKVPLRYGCASCRCGTCAVKVSGSGALDPMGDEERKLLERMHLDSSGEIRLACRAKVIDGETEVDLDFQDTYSPDQGDW